MDQYLGEIRPVGFNFAPNGWALCNGQILSISQNTALFALLGTTYGGNGTSTFALPNLQGRVTMGFSPAHPQGDSGGAESVQLTSANLPVHNHTVPANNSAATTLAVGVPATAARSIYGAATGALAADAVVPTGGGQPHENRQPVLAVTYVIALVGIFPARP